MRSSLVLVLAPGALGVVVACCKPMGSGGAGQHVGTSAGPARLTVHVYDVGQALAALVDLPDGRHVLVDAGDSPARPGCGEACASADRHLLDRLREDLAGAPLDLLWITHQHSDHIGGAPEVLEGIQVKVYADNGRDRGRAEVRRAHHAAAERGTELRFVGPGEAAPPLPSSADVKLTAILPAEWPHDCGEDANECSIGLRVDFRDSSVLFVGDAEHEEERMLDPRGPVTLLQVGHHGSATSTTPGFLVKARPRYAVISAGKPGEGYNAEFCHPRALVVKRLTAILGGPGKRPLRVFDGERCEGSSASDWIDVPASDRIWATERDGDVVLTTTGDGVFTRE